MIWSLLQGTVFMVILTIDGIEKWPKYYHIVSFFEFFLAAILFAATSGLLFRLITRQVKLS